MSDETLNITVRMRKSAYLHEGSINILRLFQVLNEKNDSKGLT